MSTTPKELSNQLSDFVNSFNTDKRKDFINAFCSEHRTLQQSAFGLFLELMEHMATDEYRTDGRNEDSKAIARVLLDGFKEAKKKEYMADGTSEQRASEYVSGNGALPSKYLGCI